MIEISGNSATMIIMVLASLVNADRMVLLVINWIAWPEEEDGRIMVSTSIEQMSIPNLPFHHSKMKIVWIVGGRFSEKGLRGMMWIQLYGKQDHPSFRWIESFTFEESVQTVEKATKTSFTSEWPYCRLILIFLASSLIRGRVKTISWLRRIMQKVTLNSTALCLLRLRDLCLGISATTMIIILASLVIADRMVLLVINGIVWIEEGSPIMGIMSGLGLLILPWLLQLLLQLVLVFLCRVLVLKFGLMVSVWMGARWHLSLRKLKHYYQKPVHTKLSQIWNTYSMLIVTLMPGKVFKLCVKMVGVKLMQRNSKTSIQTLIVHSWQNTSKETHISIMTLAHFRVLQREKILQNFVKVKPK